MHRDEVGGIAGLGLGYVVLYPVKKVIITQSSEKVLFLELTDVNNCTWLLLCAYLKDNSEECKDRNLCNWATVSEFH